MYCQHLYEEYCSAGEKGHGRLGIIVENGCQLHVFECDVMIRENGQYLVYFLLRILAFFLLHHGRNSEE